MTRQKKQSQPTLDLAIVETHLRAFCTENKLVWNEGNWAHAREHMVKAKLNTEQAQIVGRAHITLVSHLFNPAAYPFKGRVLMALHFLLNRKRK